MFPVDWRLLDEEKAPLLEQVAKDIYSGVASAVGRPERVSERLVYREMDLSAHRLENMPKCRVIFEKYTESYPENYARKIIWAYKKLQVERDKPFYWSDIRALSGVKKHNFQLARPYCRKNNIIFMYSNIIHEFFRIIINIQLVTRFF